MKKKHLKYLMEYKGIKTMSEYKKLVDLCRKKRLDFEIPCGARLHKGFILKLMGIRINLKKLNYKDCTYYLGNKYSWMAYNNKIKCGKANFNNKDVWGEINKRIK